MKFYALALLTALVLAALLAGPAQAQQQEAPRSQATVAQDGAGLDAAVTQRGGGPAAPLAAQIAQDGGGHAATQRQTYGGVFAFGGMKATIEQIGGQGHTALQVQGGGPLAGGLKQGALEATIRQIGGAGHRAEQYQAWDRNTATIEQVGGTGNVAQQTQDRAFPQDLVPLPRAFGQGAPFSAGLVQDALALSGGSRHTATITQRGAGENGARQLQLGSRHSATIEQDGEGNLAQQAQAGAQHWSDITQTGMRNEAQVTQTNLLSLGAGHVSRIMQHGTGNSVTVTQRSY